MGRIAGIARSGLMRGIRQFLPDKLVEQLSRFEGNISEALDMVENGSLAVFTPVTATTAVHQAVIGELVNVPGACTVQLPVASIQNAGRGMVIVHRQSASGTVSVWSIQNIEGAASDTLPAVVGTWLYVSLGDSWGRI